MQKWLMASALVMVTGCVSGPSPDEKMASWNGEKADSLVAVWGQPAAVDQSPQGGKTYVYRVQESRMHIIEGGFRGGERFEQDEVQCTVRFTVDAANTVRSSGLDTSEAYCDSSIAANPRQVLAH